MGGGFMSLSKVLEVAREDLGYIEIPVNRTKYWDAYDPAYQGQPWCVAAQWYWFMKAGESAAFFGGAKTASCGKLLKFYKESYQNVPIQDVAVGDLVFFNFTGGIAPEHCGLATHVERSGGSILYIKSIEGNTTPESGSGSQSNGGCVAERTRYTRNIVGVARPKYKPEEVVVVPDYKGHWYEFVFEWGIERGIVKGDPDGKYNPTKAATKAEVLTMLYNYDQYRFGGTEKA